MDSHERQGPGSPFRWVAAGLLVLLGALAGLGYALVATPQYTAQAFVVVAADPPTGDRRDVSFAQAFGRVIGQQDIARIAGGTVGLSPEEVNRAVQARTSPDAPIIEITGQATEATKAANLTNAVANALVAFATGSQKDTGVRLSVLSQATPPTSPSSPNRLLDVAVGAAAGTLLAGILLLTPFGRRRREPAGPAAAAPAASGAPRAAAPGYPPPGAPGQPAWPGQPGWQRQPAGRGTPPPAQPAPGGHPYGPPPIQPSAIPQPPSGPPPANSTLSAVAPNTPAPSWPVSIPRSPHPRIQPDVERGDGNRNVDSESTTRFVL